MLPLDKIEIRGLVLTTIVGVLPHERTMAQPVRIDLDLYVNLRESGRSDRLSDTSSYGEVADKVSQVVRESRDMLLERLAERVAAAVLSLKRIEGVEVTITKLRPPIPEHVESAGVKIRRRLGDYEGLEQGRHVVVVALGSNVGDRHAHLRSAVRSLGRVLTMSQVYETAPVGGPPGQGAFLNMVLSVSTALDPYAFLRRCHAVEAAALRDRSIHWGPRTLDIDILFYDDVRIEDPNLMIPHPRFAERRFVLAPLSEVAPERCPPGWQERLPKEDVQGRGPLPESHEGT